MDFQKFFPKYKKTLNVNLAENYEKLPPKLKKFDLDYLIEASAVYSSNIEGNPMDLNSFMNSKMLKTKQKPKEFVEIMELAGAYAFAGKNKLNELNLLKAHKMLSRSFLIKSKTGKYRNERVGVFDKNGLVYLAIEPENVKKEMKKLFNEIEKLLALKMKIEEIFYWASILHLRFAHIHPFADGNGRTARLLEKWFLAYKLDKKAWIIQSEKYYKENLPKYYKNINLGPNYYDLNYSKCSPFLLMLPNALKRS